MYNLGLVRKILIANRGEIAVRVLRAARDAGLATVAVYSDCDRPARHVRMADEAWPLGGNRPADSYLRIDALIDIARRAGADAVHPGYGFLAENAAFAEACRDAGLTFIGPTPEAIRLMGSKTAAREAAEAAGVAAVPGTAAPLPADLPEPDVLQIATQVGFPLMLKAVAGGGGKGMRMVAAPDDLPSALRAARSEAQSAFGDGAVYVERRLERPRHIEVQLLGDVHGTVLPFVERECSLQRRHQKVLEESPSPAVDATLRTALCDWHIARNRLPQRPQVEPLAVKQLANGILRVGKRISDRRSFTRRDRLDVARAHPSSEDRSHEDRD